MTTFSERLSRRWRHFRTTSAQGRSMFSAEALANIGAAITAGEQRHRGEMRLIVEHAMPAEAIWDDVSNRQRAIALFAQYGVWDTEDNCGVLIYVNLAERKVDIVADRNIDRKIDPATWQQVCGVMTQGFAKGDFEVSTLAAVERVNGLLEQHFAATGPRANELPDHPLVL